jgi:transposase
VTRSNKVELFEQIRRDYEFGEGTIAGLARKYGVHRRMVRQALSSAVPPARKRVSKACPRLAPVQAFIDQILEQDRHVPRKQRHTAHRIYTRLQAEQGKHPLSERRVRQYVRDRKRALGLLKAEVMVPQSYHYGHEGQVDWYEASIDLAGERQVVKIFALRAMASGASYHRAYPQATQQAFLDAHQQAFHYFGGVFRRLRYDNLSSAVQKILRGYRREETERFHPFRSHWQYDASFCNRGQGHEKGGVEGEVGHFRRNYLVPIPHVGSFAELNEFLAHACRTDLNRRIDGQEQRIGQALVHEQNALLPLPVEDFAIAEEHFCAVNAKGCVRAGTNHYSTPLPPASEVRVQLWPLSVRVWYQGQLVAEHTRCYQRRKQILELEHYLEVLERKPGALAGSTPLAQWRQAGRWTPRHDRFLAQLIDRHGQLEGTRLMVELLRLGQTHGYDRLTLAIDQALTCGAQDAAAVCYLLTAPGLEEPRTATVYPTTGRDWPAMTRALPTVAQYDQLVGAAPPEVAP